MELRDLIVTPIILLLVYAGAYMVRPNITDATTRVYFFPALTLKIIGAIAIGLLYQFYYGGGDTFTFHTLGSRIIWEAFIDSPLTGLKLIFSDRSSHEGIYAYSSKIAFFHDAQSYNVVRISALFDLITFSSYSATAVLFSVFSFTGMWMFFVTFYKQYPTLHRSLAIAVLFIPSVAVWGSGIFKDTLTLGCLGIATYCLHAIFFEHKIKAIPILLLLFSIYIIYCIKIFILQAFIPAACVWIIAQKFGTIPSLVLKILLVPFVILIMLGSGYFAIKEIGEDNSKYSLENIAKTAKVTAYDIRYWSGREAGSGYSIGELDGTFSSMVKLSPQAINVSLFRPYLWEVRNPLMLLSAVESLAILLITLYVLLKRRVSIFQAIWDPNVLFFLIFSLTFAFAVGVSTFNFGTLARYKIPLLPFYGLALVYIFNYETKDKKVEVLDSTEY